MFQARLKMLVLVPFLLLASCSDDKQASPPPPSLDKALREAGNPSFNIMTNLLIQKNRQAFAGSDLSKNLSDWKMDDYKKAITSVTPQDVATRSPWETKMHVEAKLTEMNGGKELMYNRNHITVGSPLRLARMQCYSGSILELLVQRQSNAKDFMSKRMVMILSPGHILPAFMIPEGEDYRMVGLETTVAGQGRTDFGLTKNLNTALRVIDADLFTQIEVFADVLDNQQEVVKWALEETAKLYNIPLEITEQKIAAEEAKVQTLVQKDANVGKSAQRAINQSIFGFATDAEPPREGDIKREVLDEVKVTEQFTTAFVQTQKRPPEGAVKLDGPGGGGLPTPKLETSKRKSRLAESTFGSQLVLMSRVEQEAFSNTACPQDVYAQGLMQTFIDQLMMFLTPLDQMNESQLADKDAVTRALEKGLDELLASKELKKSNVSKEMAPEVKCLYSNDKEAHIVCEFATGTAYLPAKKDAVKDGLKQEGLAFFSIIIKDKKLIYLEARGAATVADSRETRHTPIRLTFKDELMTEDEHLLFSRWEVFGPTSTFYIHDARPAFSDTLSFMEFSEAYNDPITKALNPRVSAGIKGMENKRIEPSYCAPYVPGSEKEIPGSTVMGEISGQNQKKSTLEF